MLLIFTKNFAPLLKLFIKKIHSNSVNYGLNVKYFGNSYTTN